MRATRYPKKHPIETDTTTFKGMNHQSVMFLRVIAWPKLLKIKQGKNKANTSLLRSLNVALGTNFSFGCAKSTPNKVKEISFSNGTIEMNKIFPFNPLFSI